MSTLLLLVLSIVLLGSVAYFRLSRLIWSPILIILLADAQYIGSLSWIASIFLWPAAITALLITWLPVVRQQLVTKPLFEFFKKNLPPLSDTEKAAIESGTVWWEAKLFQGQADWQKLWEMPKPALTPDEEAFLHNEVHTLCNMVNDWEITHEKADLTEEVWGYLKNNKFFGMIIPKEYGGLGFSALMHSNVITKLATKSVSLAVTAMVPNSLGPGELLINYGTPEQKQYFLPRLATGKEIPCFALTGPEAGSDAGSIPDQGIVCKGTFEGKEIVGISLQFDKRYITLAPVATLVGLAFKLYDPEHLLSTKTDVGITLALIPATHPGVEIGARHHPLRLAFMNGPIRGRDVFIPLDWIIGGVAMAGKGWQMLFECLSVGRGISLPALSTGTASLSYVATGAYAAIRKQFNLPIGQFEGVEEALARIGGFAYQLEAARVFTAQAIDLHERPAVATAIAKYHMTEMSRKVNNAAMDIHGGRAIMMGPLNYLGVSYQAMPLSITVEGANILTRSLMIFGQGAIRCHPYLKDELLTLDAYKDDQKLALKQFDKICIQHIGYAISNFMRTITLALTLGKATELRASQDIKSYLQNLNWLSAGLAWISDIAMLTLGGALKRKELLSARLGDVLSHLYLSSALLKYYQDGEKTAEEKNLLHWGLQYNLYQIQEAYYGLFENFPNRLLGTFMRWVIFPYGRRFRKSNDEMSHLVAKDLLTESPIRQHFSQLCFIGHSLNDPMGLIEQTFKQLQIAKPVLEKLVQAIKAGNIHRSLSLRAQLQAAMAKSILTQNEVNIVEKYEQLRVKAIAVDEFPSDYPLGSEICKNQTKQHSDEQSIL